MLSQRKLLEAEQPRVKSKASAPTDWPRLGAPRAFSMGTPESVSLGEAGGGEMETSRTMTPKSPLQDSQTAAAGTSHRLWLANVPQILKQHVCPEWPGGHQAPA